MLALFRLNSAAHLRRRGEPLGDHAAGEDRPADLRAASRTVPALVSRQCEFIPRGFEISTAVPFAVRLVSAT